MPRKGEQMSPEHKAKIAAALRGNRNAAGERNAMKRPEIAAKVSAALRGVSRLSSIAERRLQTKVCECGCGAIIPKYRGGTGPVENRFMVGHQGRGRKRPDFAANVTKANRNRRGDLNPARRLDVRSKISATMSGRIPVRILRLMESKTQRTTETTLCECGCGTVIKKWNSGNTTRLNRFVVGHHSRGRKRPDFSAWLRENAKASADSRKHPRGEAHWNWKGGISVQEHLERNSPRYRAWRDKVYRRDGWRCTSCHRHLQKGDITADHVVPWSEAPDLRYEVSNGRALCRECHARRHGLGTA